MVRASRYAGADAEGRSAGAGDRFVPRRAGGARRSRAVAERSPTYANRVVPRCKGRAAQILQVAEGYKQQAVAEAKGQSARFLKVYDEYKKAPERYPAAASIWRRMERILGSSEKLLYDGGSSSFSEHRAVSALERTDAAASGGAGHDGAAATAERGQPMRSPVTVLPRCSCCLSSSSSVTARCSPWRRPNRCWWFGSVSRSVSSPNRA